MICQRTLRASAGGITRPMGCSPDSRQPLASKPGSQAWDGELLHWHAPCFPVPLSVPCAGKKHPGTQGQATRHRLWQHRQHQFLTDFAPAKALEIYTSGSITATQTEPYPQHVCCAGQPVMQHAHTEGCRSKQTAIDQLIQLWPSSHCLLDLQVPDIS